MNGRLLSTIALTSLLVLSITVTATPSEAKRWALIVAPEHEGGTVYEDALDMYNYLIDQGYNDDEIIFLTDGSTEHFVDGDATHEEIVVAFARLSANVALNDKVSLILGDNGAFGGGDSYLITSDKVLISETEIASMVDNIAAKNIAIVVSFDYSGGFIDALCGNGRLVLTSHAIEATTTNNYNIVDGLTEEGADTNSDGKVSFEEAHIWVAGQIYGQTPQMSDGIVEGYTL